jgi:hypothetical protein
MSGLTTLAVREQSAYQRDEIDSLKARVRILETQELPFVSRLRIDAKGDLFAGTADNAYARLPVGANGQVIIADSTQSTGLRWESMITAIVDGSITNAKLADMEAARVKGRAGGGGTGAPQDLTATQLNAIIATADLLHTNRIWSGVGSDEGRGQTGIPPLTVKGNSLLIYRETNDSQSPNLEFLKRRDGTGTPVQNGDRLGSIVWTGADTTTFGAIGAIIRAEVDGTPGSADMPGRILFLTSPDGTGSPAESFRVNALQNLVMASGKRIETAEIRARDGDGLLLRDNGGNSGVFIQHATGNVGLKTSSLITNAALTVDGPVGLTYSRGALASVAFPIIYGTTASGSAYPFLESGNLVLEPRQSGGVNRDIVFSTGGNPTMIVARTSAVGILSTDPKALLHVGSGTASPTSAAAIIAQRNADTAVACRHVGNNTEVFMLADNAGSIGMATNHALRIFAGAAERVRISTDGNVGIGRTSPLHMLHVGAGGATLTTTGPTITTQIAGITALVLRNTSDNVEAFIQSSISDARIGTATNHPLLFRTNNATIARFDTSGNLGIRVTSPSAILSLAAGSGSGIANAGGLLNQSTSQVGNSGSSETDLASYSVPANTLAVNGQALYFEASGTTAVNTNSKVIRVRFGSSGTNLILQSLSFNVAIATPWVVRGRVIRTGSSSQKGYAEWTNNQRSPDVGLATGLNQTLSSAVSLRVTGQSTSSNDIILETFRVFWEPAT